MTQIEIKYKLGSEVFLEKKIPYSFCFNKDGTNIQSEVFPENILLGNFTNALLWKSILSNQIHFHGFEKLIPLSRIKITDDLLHLIQKNFVKKLDIDESKDFGIRKYGYQSIFKYLLDLSSIDVHSLIQSLKLSPFSIQDTEISNELMINSNNLNVLSKAYQSVWEGQMEYFNSSPLRFLPKQLLHNELSELNGFIYENSGYNSHLVYLPQLQASFIFCGDLSFFEVWFLFVQTLSEIDYFNNDVYLSKLMRVICPYPWANVEVTSVD